MSSKLHARLLALLKFDRAISARFSRASTRPAVRQFFRAVSWLGNGYFWYALMGLLVVWYGKPAWYPVLHMIVAGLSGTLIYKRLKKSTLRPRPFTVHKEIAQGVAILDQYSFPSGHTLHAVTFAVVASIYFPWLSWPVGGFAALVALSRLVLGVHYPTDVIAGAILGALIAGLSFLVF